MSDLIADSWEKDYLKKADRFEKICAKTDKLGYEHDLQGSSATAEYACKFLKKVSLYSKILSVFFFLIILAAHKTSDYSSTVLKFDEGYFEKITPVKVEK